MESHKVALKYPCQSYEDESIEDASFFTYTVFWKQVNCLYRNLHVRGFNLILILHLCGGDIERYS